MRERLEDDLANAVIGVDTLWGGDVMNPSGTGRFIADSWFSDRPLPRAYLHDAADALRRMGGIGGAKPDLDAVEDYLDAVDVRTSIECLFGDAAGRTLGFTPRGLSPWAGLALALHDARLATTYLRGSALTGGR